MKRPAVIVLALLLSFMAEAQSLDEKLGEYLSAIDRLPIPEAQAEADFLISSVQDSSLRSGIATKVYEHFRDSKVMGSENVAVYVYDKWFATFRAAFDDIDKLDAAEFHAFVNRRSLIGAKASTLKYATEKGDTLSFPRKGRRTILYFYTTGCPKCLYNSVTMSKLLNDNKYRTDVVCVFTGDDDSAWKSYTMRELKIRKTCRTKVFHVTPADDDFVTAYSVIQTPRLLLISRDGHVIGRSLDANALETLLNSSK